MSAWPGHLFINFGNNTLFLEFPILSKFTTYPCLISMAPEGVCACVTEIRGGGDGECLGRGEGFRTLFYFIVTQKAYLPCTHRRKRVRVHMRTHAHTHKH